MWTKPTTAKQKTPVPEGKSLESLCELEKQKKLLIILLKSGRSRVCVSSRSRRSRRFSRTGREVIEKHAKEPELKSLERYELEKLEKFFVKVLK